MGLAADLVLLRDPMQEQVSEAPAPTDGPIVIIPGFDGKAQMNAVSKPTKAKQLVMTCFSERCCDNRHDGPESKS